MNKGLTAEKTAAVNEVHWETYKCRNTAILSYYISVQATVDKDPLGHQIGPCALLYSGPNNRY